MDFFKRFKELYNFSKSVESTIYITDEAWLDFQNKIKNYNIENYNNQFIILIHSGNHWDYAIPKQAFNYELDRNDISNSVTYKEILIKYNIFFENMNSKESTIIKKSIDSFAKTLANADQHKKFEEKTVTECAKSARVIYPDIIN
jgi:hypothetical protein